LPPNSTECREFPDDKSEKLVYAEITIGQDRGFLFADDCGDADRPAVSAVKTEKNRKLGGRT